MFQLKRLSIGQSLALLWIGMFGVVGHSNADPIRPLDRAYQGLLHEGALSQGESSDCDGNGVPDEEQSAEDCNANGVQDFCDISYQTSTDCNENGVPDECDLETGVIDDCNGNGEPDACEVATLDADVDWALESPGFVRNGFTVTEFANELSYPAALLISEAGPFGAFLYVGEETEDGQEFLTRIDPAGNKSVFATAIRSRIKTMVFGPGGEWGRDLYVSFRSEQLARINPAGDVTELFLGSVGYGIAFFDGLLYAGDYPGGIKSIDPLGISSTLVGQILGRVVDLVYGDAPGFEGFLYAADDADHVIWRIEFNGQVSSFPSPFRWSPHSLAFGPGGRFGKDLLPGAISIEHVHTAA